MNSMRKKETLYTYHLYIDKLDQRVSLADEELSLVNINDNNKILNFKKAFEEMNQDIERDSVFNSYKEKWDINSDNTVPCTYNADDNTPLHDDPVIYNPKKCRPYNKKWVRDSETLKYNAEIASDIVDFILNADQTGKLNEGQPDEKDVYYRQTLEDLKTAYVAYLQKYVDALDKFNNTISKITNKLNEYTGGSEMFSFINCAFVGTNLKIILKYLKDIFGGDIYTIGVSLILAGCSMALSISFTILLIVIINVSVDENKKNAK